jgi:hypothetical protein
MIEFEGPDGTRIEQFHHVPVRKVVVDGVVYRRAAVPGGFSVNLGARPLEQKDEIKASLRRDELAAKPWASKYTPRQIKSIWGI